MSTATLTKGTTNGARHPNEDGDANLVEEEDVVKLRKHLLACTEVDSKSRNLELLLRTLDSIGGLGTNRDPNGSSGHANPEEVTLVEVLQEQKRKSSTRTRVLNIILLLFRSFCLDLPLLLIFASLVVTSIYLYVHDTYLAPQSQLLKWTPKRQIQELTYFERTCNASSITAHSADELILPKDGTMNAQQASDHLLRHGVQVYQSLLRPNTAHELRKWILRENKVQDGFFVIEKEHRWSFGIDVNAHPSVQQALKEIGTNQQLRDNLAEITGNKNPAVVEFTAITSAKGAKDQFWHQDVIPKGSAFKYSRSFVATYSLFIPLQDTYPSMGPTEVCPGTHVCNGKIEEICEEDKFVRMTDGTGRVWKMGNGALVNQQLFHRGPGHTGGDHRVLFILTFASRPRFGKNQLEPRLIGLGGSYSLKWDQWGHTLDDFTNPAVRMAQPWRALQSIGVFKLPNKQWGWDMTSVALARVTHNQEGYRDYQLEDYVEQGGPWWLPQLFVAPVADDEGWLEWWRKSIFKLHEGLKTANLYVILVYAMVLLIWTTATSCLSKAGLSHAKKTLQNAFLRVLITYSLVAGFAYVGLKRMENGTWARNVRAGRAFRPVMFESKRAEACATIPLESDILKSTRFGSNFLASQNRLFDISHPGNAKWCSLIRQNSVNYLRLSKDLQEALKVSLLDETKRDFRARFLQQNGSGEWITMDDGIALDSIHADLTIADQGNVKVAVDQLASQLAELEFGVFRRSAMHQSDIRDLLLDLKHRILRAEEKKVATRILNRSVPIKATKLTGLSLLSLASRSPARVEAASLTPSQRSSIPKRKKIEPPFPSAWIKEGDIVDGQYQAKHNEFYRAVVTRASANRNRFDIRYDDGDEDKSLPHYAVRPYTPPQVDELIAIKLKGSGNFVDGRVVGVVEGGRLMYNVETHEFGLHENVTTAEIRRFDWSFTEGAAVEAKFLAQGDIWYRGKITRVCQDGTFDIKYDDDEIVEYEVEAKDVRIAGTSSS